MSSSSRWMWCMMTTCRGTCLLTADAGQPPRSIRPARLCRLMAALRHLSQAAAFRSHVAGMDVAAAHRDGIVAFVCNSRDTSLPAFLLDRVLGETDLTAILAGDIDDARAASLNYTVKSELSAIADDASVATHDVLSDVANTVVRPILMQYMSSGSTCEVLSAFSITTVIQARLWRAPFPVVLQNAQDYRLAPSNTPLWRLVDRFQDEPDIVTVHVNHANPDLSVIVLPGLVRDGPIVLFTAGRPRMDVPGVNAETLTANDLPSILTGPETVTLARGIRGLPGDLQSAMAEFERRRSAVPAVPSAIVSEPHPPPPAERPLETARGRRSRDANAPDTYSQNVDDTVKPALWAGDHPPGELAVIQ